MGALSMMTLVVVGIIALIVIGILIAFTKFYVKVPQGWALIVNDTTSMPKVKFTGGIVWPIINKKELMKVSLITLQIDRAKKEGLICKDNIRADISVAFYLRVNETQEDVLKVAKSIGVDRASDKDAVNELFNAKFAEALKTVGKQMNFIDLFEDRIGFRDKIVEVIGNDLNGYALEDVAIDYLEQTPKSALDPNNILDAEGIRKITELTATHNVVTNELERNEQLAVKKKDVETRESMLALERQEADAEAKQKREIETIQAREEAETAKICEEERLRSEQARIETEEHLMIREENKNREVEVAHNNRQRAVVIEEEKVIRAQELEAVSRQREVELQRIDKEKALEVQKKEIANTVRERVMVDKTVAEQEEKINEVREVSEAERQKQVAILNAQAEAEEDLVKQVKQAEADEVKAKHKAEEINILAVAELEASAKQADAKVKLAEGIKAEHAAVGLADALVKEAQAEALEKEGLAEAKVREELLTAEARGEKERGLAEAEVIRTRFQAEAEGLIEKFKAMDQMSDTARDHEEFRLKLEKEFDRAMADIAANQVVSVEQAQAMAKALQNAKVDIVGGDGDFFKSFSRSLALGKSIEGVVEKSPTVEQLIQKFVKGATDKTGT
ncbi:MAG: Inner membrane protein YqiK [uncultured Thiotrichaceae bacterium]|uniref:Inner membrane protein YqiK n=1 Tax=uncultured Thiotrichaceae bacterium TaxID=298394 RepID=A0A6S6SAQ8_9GAMM|nr:MAG: Inner membrane protein YqiK [uncultured Thiotrichaceae bacterium]